MERWTLTLGYIRTFGEIGPVLGFAAAHQVQQLLRGTLGAPTAVAALLGHRARDPWAFRSRVV